MKKNKNSELLESIGTEELVMALIGVASAIDTLSTCSVNNQRLLNYMVTELFTTYMQTIISTGEDEDVPIMLEHLAMGIEKRTKSKLNIVYVKDL